MTSPLAFPPVIFNETAAIDNNKPVVFLHAGNQSLTKASHILYKAWQNCNFGETEAELWLIGRMALPASFSKDLPGKVIIKNNIPHPELMALYKKANVLVMPTLADGFGMVITEAMSQGVPVISSTNCCGPDVIEHMKDGWVIPAGDISALEAQMKWCVTNKTLLHEMGVEARTKASGWQWPQYRQKFSETIFNKWEAFQR
jgi:glycosyltransferase involved in cell wall biosynthesis